MDSNCNAVDEGNDQHIFVLKIKKKLKERNKTFLKEKYNGLMKGGEF